MKRIWKQSWNILTLFVLVVSALAVSPRPAHAGAIITVNTASDLFNDDAGTCSLRMAIYAANHDQKKGGCAAGSGADMIILPRRDASQDYILSLTGVNEDDDKTGDLDITDNLYIAGQGALESGGSKIYAAGLGDRVFEVTSPGTTQITVTFSNLVIDHGKVSGTTGDANRGGGGILINSANPAVGAHVILDRVLFISNDGDYAGGGISNYYNSILEVTNSTFNLNVADYGGAIYNLGKLYLKTSLLNGNSGFSEGGGLDNRITGSFASIINSTVGENYTSDSSTSAGGGGILNAGTLDVVNSTIAENTGTGIMLKSQSITTIRNSIIAQPKKPNCETEEGTTFTSFGYNLVYNLVTTPTGPGRTQCPWKVTTIDLVGSTSDYDPHLSSLLLSNNSPTRTYQFTDLSTANKAIDAIPAGNGCPGFDQRGYPRFVEGNIPAAGLALCDIGAYEVGGTIIFTYLPSMSR